MPIIKIHNVGNILAMSGMYLCICIYVCACWEILIVASNGFA